jgi:CRISPR/Cas system-associated exonuclease Cas4 (RecB family)
MYKLSPSKAHRFLNCTKSLVYDVERIETPAAKRGSFIHEMAELSIKGQLDDYMDLSNYEIFLINSYTEAVESERTRIGAHKIEVEVKDKLEIFGTSNNYIVDARAIKAEKAAIIDLKSGSYDVEPEGNEQLLYYALGTILKFPKIKTVRASIFQKGKLKTVVLTADEVLDFFVSVQGVYEDIRNNNLTYNPSEKACKFCPHKDECLARANWILGGKNNGKV